MALPVWMDNLLAYCLQMAILAAAGTLLAYIFRLRIPRISLIYWQVLLIACLALPLMQKWEKPAAVSTDVTIQMTEMTIPNTGTGVVSSPPSSPKISATDAVVLIFAAGALLRLFWLALGFYRLRLLLRRSEPIDRMPPVAERISSLIGVRARFYLSDETDSPATFGIFNPTVILPRTFPEMREACREAILCHELLHVRRRDWALIFIEEMIRTLFWFHPAVWWLLSRIHLTREQSVDHEVVRLTGNRQPYLDSLLEIARKLGRPRAVPAPLFLRERHLVERVALLIKEVSMNRLRLVLSLSGIAVILAGTVSLAAGWFPLTGPALIVQEEISAEKIDSQQVHLPDAQSDPTPAPTPQTQTVSQPIRLKQPTGSESNGKFELHYSDADLRSFIQQISELLGLTPLIIDPEVQGTATVHSSEPISKREVLDLFNLTLKNNNVSLIKQNGIYLVVPLSADLKTDVDNIKHQAAYITYETTPKNSAIPRQEEGGIVGKIPGGVVGSFVGVSDDPGSGGGTDTSEGAFVGPGEGGGMGSYSSRQTTTRIGSNVLQSKLIHRVAPVYPEEAKAGQVILNITVNEKGEVSNVEVLDGDPLYIDAVVAAVKQWKYEPTLLNGTPIPVISTITVKRNVVSPTQFVSPTEIPINPNPENAEWIDGNVLQSKLIHKVDPEYPELARRARVKGKVNLAVTVTEEGYVSNVEVIGGHPMLRDAAEKAVKQWKYEPTVLNGKAIPVIATVTVDFVLPEDTETDESPPM
ncbi:MAG: TonB family protein [Acidobacteria bacterium]|nr:TonB family protein [Acidobacteriota bacterium]